MAKTKVVVNKSEEIRRVLADSPEAMAKEVVATLKEQGFDISEALVYAVKKNLKPAKKKAAEAKTTVVARTTPKVVSHSSNGRLGVGVSIGVARAAAEKVGGLKALKEIVDALQ